MQSITGDVFFAKFTRGVMKGGYAMKKALKILLYIVLAVAIIIILRASVKVIF